MPGQESSCQAGGRGGFAALLLTCCASILLHVLLFGAVLDRPLTLGLLRAELDAGLARGAALRGPKLVILAGSNGPYSHRCEVMEPILGRPCVNGGVAVGVGLDYLFARWRAVLHPGDTVYLPMEEAQYVRTRSAAMVGPEALIMLRHDRATLARMPPGRWAGALFAGDLRGAALSLVEMALVAGGFHDPRPEAIGTTNAWGDHIGHTVERGRANAAVLASAQPVHASAGAVRAGYGTRLIGMFADWARANGIRVIGGLPTGFADSPMPEDVRLAIRETYLGHGAEFLELPNRSRYPRAAFFDTPDHLNEAWQIAHSVAVARALSGSWRSAGIGR